MPGDLVGGVADEVIVPEVGPDLLDVVGLFDLRPDQGKGLLLYFLQPFLLVYGIFQAAAQGQQGLLVQVREQGILPAVPQLRIGAVDVRHGEHVQIVQVHDIADRGGEMVNDVGVVDILALGGLGHQQVLFHQPGHQA